MFVSSSFSFCKSVLICFSLLCSTILFYYNNKINSWLYYIILCKFEYLLKSNRSFLALIVSIFKASAISAISFLTLVSSSSLRLILDSKSLCSVFSSFCFTSNSPIFSLYWRDRSLQTSKVFRPLSFDCNSNSKFCSVLALVFYYVIRY